VGYILLILVVPFALVVLILLNLSLRRLWGELAYAIVVTAVAVWALGQIGAVKEVLGHFSVQPYSLKRALLWSTFALVALPVAWVHRWYGVFLLALGPLAALVLYLLGKPDWRSPWVSAAGGICLVLLVGATVGPLVGALKPAENAPDAAEERTENRALAEQVRPILFFDGVEQRFPADVAELMRLEHVHSCRDAIPRDKCDLVTRPEGLDLGADYLKFDDVPFPRGGGEASAYYYRVVDDRPGWIFVDYWWFFTRNPTPIVGGAMCAPGFRIPGTTCHDHPADWEGITVVLRPCPQGRVRCATTASGDVRRWAPVAVRYAQHEFIVSYEWEPTLESLWSGIKRDPLRPIVFVARDSHASYAGRCRRLCKQFRLGVLRREGTHNGRTQWHWNEPRCGDCLLPLPITSGGAPAEWNAFKGKWGKQNCLLGGAYCDATGAPKAPPEQDRYTTPWQKGPWLCLANPNDRDSRGVRRCARAETPEEFLQ
jgi:hypothetical protein